MEFKLLHNTSYTLDKYSRNKCSNFSSKFPSMKVKRSRSLKAEYIKSQCFSQQKNPNHLQCNTLSNSTSHMHKLEKSSRVQLTNYSEIFWRPETKSNTDPLGQGLTHFKALVYPEQNLLKSFSYTESLQNDMPILKTRQTSGRVNTVHK